MFGAEKYFFRFVLIFLKILSGKMHLCYWTLTSNKEKKSTRKDKQMLKYWCGFYFPNSLFFR